MTTDSSRGDPFRPEFMVLLGVFPPYTAADVKQAYLAKVRNAHPDHGGKPDDFLKLQEAFERANEYVEFRANRMRWLGGQVERYARQEKMVERLKDLGARAEIERTDWLNRSFGEDFAQVADRVIGLDARGARDVLGVIETLEEYRDQATTIRWIDLGQTTCSDDEVFRLATLSQLTALDLRHTRVTAEALQLADSLPELKWINLAGVGVSAWQRMRMGWKHRQVQLSTDENETARQAAGIK